LLSPPNYHSTENTPRLNENKLEAENRVQNGRSEAERIERSQKRFSKSSDTKRNKMK